MNFDLTKVKQRLVEMLGQEAAETVNVEVYQAKLEDNFQLDDSVKGLLSSLCATNSLADAKSAGRSVLGDNGKPRMMKVTAWMAHADYVNKNRYRFEAEDLQEAVNDGLFTAPYFGMLDYNHDFQLYGIWYKTEYKYNPLAGKYGVLAEGVLFAWRFPDLADRMLAEQSRNGYIPVSNACYAEYITEAEDENGAYINLRKPKFFANSILDIPPADNFGQGIVSESETQTPEEREDTLLALAQELLEGNPNKPEVEMTPEQLEALINNFREAVDESNQAQFAPLLAAAEKLAQVEADLTAKASELETAAARVTELESELESAVAARDEKAIAVDSLTSQLEAANTELVELREFKTNAETAAAEAAAQEIRQSRLAELNTAAKAAFERAEEATRERMIARWVSLPDEEWELVKNSLNGNPFEASTNAEGTLTPGLGIEDRKNSKFAIDDYVK